MASKVVTSALRIVTNAAVVLGFGLLAYACYRKYRDTGATNWFGLLVVNSLFVTMYIVKRDATSVSLSPALWLLAFGGTCLPLAMRPLTPGPSTLTGNLLQLAGLCAVAASLLSLRRSFGIVPAHRGIRTRGLYNFVRHPLYASEMLTILGVAIANPSTWNISLWVGDCLLQVARARAEERFLSADPVYLHYRARTKYRFIPGLI